MTLQDIKNPSKEIIDSAKIVFEKMTTVEVIQEKIIPAQISNLQTVNGKDHYTGETVNNPDYSYRLDDEDFEKYLDLNRKSYKKLGFDVPEDQCPLLIAESELTDAKHELVKSAESLTGITLDQALLKLSLYKEYVETLLSISAKHIN